MKARSFKDGKIILLLIPFLIVVMLTSCISVIHAAAVSDRTLQSSAVDIRYFNATSKAEASIARASTTSQGNASSSLFTVDRWQEEDYSANLHPEKYLSYYSDTEDFFSVTRRISITMLSAISAPSNFTWAGMLRHMFLLGAKVLPWLFACSSATTT